MATRVLTTIKDKNKLVGFTIICSLKSHQGMHKLQLKDAVNFYRMVEEFENVQYKNGKWEGLECSIDRLPAQDMQGNYISKEADLFVMAKMTNDAGDLIEYKLMDLLGNVVYKSIPETMQLANQYGLINAKVVTKDSTEPYISGLRGNIRKYVKKPPQGAVLRPDPAPVSATIPHTFLQAPNPATQGTAIKIVAPVQTPKATPANINNAKVLEVALMLEGRAKGKLTDADFEAKFGYPTGTPEFVKALATYIGDPTLDYKNIMAIVATAYKKYSEDKMQNPPKSAIPSQPVTAPIMVHTQLDKKMQRLQELTDLLTRAAEAYYNDDTEIMSNQEYDKLSDELEALEKELGVTLSGSITNTVGPAVVGKLTKVRHPEKMLSLDKTKDRANLAASLGGQIGFLGWKLDGLTVVLTYENGMLQSAVTRGDGSIGEDITHNAKVFKNVPLNIGYKDRLVIRGEAIITYAEFDRINKGLPVGTPLYKNARNLASGSVRQLDAKIAKKRNVQFILFTVVEGFNALRNYTEKLEEARKLGFTVVEYKRVKPDEVVDAIGLFELKVEKYPIPTDGLVISIDDIAYGASLGTTSKFPRNAKAFKWKDEKVESTIKGVDWSASRTGAINPVAMFEPVDIEGSTVARASVHNVSILKQLQLGYGDTVTVYKANMIIPQIAENLTRSGTIQPPDICPVCGGATEIRISDADKSGKIKVETLFCTNSACLAKHIGGLVHFASRDAINIDGMSESAMEDFVNAGLICDFKHIYHLAQHENVIVNMPGWGKGSYTKMIKAVEKSRDCELPAFLYALGVEQLGRSTSKDICKAYDYDLEAIITATVDDLQNVPNVGEKTATEIAKYFKANADSVRALAEEFTFKVMPKVDKNSKIAGMVFVITGDVYNFKNRKELQAKIESLGAKASGSVSANTTYLINNDITSNSGKNQTAKSLGIPIISEADFLKMIEN